MIPLPQLSPSFGSHIYYKKKYSCIKRHQVDKWQAESSFYILGERYSMTNSYPHHVMSAPKNK